MRDYHAMYDDETKEFVGIDYKGIQTLNIDQTVDKLNRLEETRQRHKKEIMKLRRRETRFQSIVSGLMSFLDLKFNDDLWWDEDD